MPHLLEPDRHRARLSGVFRKYPCGLLPSLIEFSSGCRENRRVNSSHSSTEQSKKGVIRSIATDAHEGYLTSLKVRKYGRLR